MLKYAFEFGRKLAFEKEANRLRQLASRAAPGLLSQNPAEFEAAKKLISPALPQARNPGAFSSPQDLLNAFNRRVELGADSARMRSPEDFVRRELSPAPMTPARNKLEKTHTFLRPGDAARHLHQQRQKAEWTKQQGFGTWLKDLFFGE